MEENKKPKTTVEKLMAQHEQRKALGDIASEHVEDYKMALNAIAASENGQYVFKMLIQICGVFAPDKGTDVATLLRHSERRNVYLELIRPFLEPDVKRKLEN